MHDLHIGCSGWAYDHWREPVYDRAPQRAWLELYAAQFPTVEVNTTFYRLPQLSMVEGWAARSPAGFLFAVKVSRYLTHVKRLASVAGMIDPLLERLAPLADAGKLGPIVWQFPANFHRDDDRLGRALPLLPPGRHCFEFRHESWFTEEVYKQLRAHGAALVIGDHPERPFQTYEFTTDWTLVRLHHGHRGRNGKYSETELDEWAQRITEWRRRAEILVYFNNDWEGFAVENGLSLMRRVRRSPGD